MENKKIVVFGDIHGRTIWKQILEQEKPDKAIFLGDYVSTHEDVSAWDQLANLYRILDWNECETILLRGNHDLQHLGYSWAGCSGFDPAVADGMADLKGEFLKRTKWAHEETVGDKHVIFSHAGISEVWIFEAIKNLMPTDPELIDKINALEPSEIFGFNGDPGDFIGNSMQQPCTWIRPASLVLGWLNGTTQVVGHTPSEHIKEFKMDFCEGDSLWLCDALGAGEYLVIEDGQFIPKTFKAE